MRGRNHWQVKCQSFQSAPSANVCGVEPESQLALGELLPALLESWKASGAALSPTQEISWKKYVFPHIRKVFQLLTSWKWAKNYRQPLTKPQFLQRTVWAVPSKRWDLGPCFSWMSSFQEAWVVFSVHSHILRTFPRISSISLSFQLIRWHQGALHLCRCGFLVAWNSFHRGELLSLPWKALFCCVKRQQDWLCFPEHIWQWLQLGVKQQLRAGLAPLSHCWDRELLKGPR